MSVRSPILIALFAVLALSACDKDKINSLLNPSSKPLSGQLETTPAMNDDSQQALFADPQPGDLYATEVSHFSGYSYESFDGLAYALMQVVAVDERRITLYTATNAWPKPRGAINDLHGNLSNIEWDDEEEITIARSEVEKLIANRKLLEARRPGEGSGVQVATENASGADSEQNALLANPQRGDLYAAELTYFSGVEFNDDPNYVCYGLMRVIAVDANGKLTLNTENYCSERRSQARTKLSGNLHDVEWDEEEEIFIQRSELPQLLANKKILAVRRR